MNAIEKQHLIAVFEELPRWAADRVKPDEARKRVAACAPGLDVELVWLKESHDGSLHYDALVHVAGGTLSVAFAPASVLPWPLRGAQRWADHELLRVNLQTLTTDDAMAAMDLAWNEAPILERLVDICLVREELERHAVDIQPEDVQEWLDGFRRARRLYSTESTERWMAERGLCHEQLELIAAEEARMAGLRRRVSAGRVEAYFVAHRDEYERAYVARLRFADRDEAAQAQAGGAVGFWAAAERNAAAVAGAPVFQVVDRCDAATAAVFALQPGEQIGPLPCTDGWAVMRLCERQAAVLDARTADRIERRLFSEWLNERRRTARIEWNWGRART